MKGLSGHDPPPRANRGTVTPHELAWRPSSGPSARTTAEQAEFLARRAADGEFLIRTFGITPTAPRRTNLCGTRSPWSTAVSVDSDDPESTSESESPPDGSREARRGPQDGLAQIAMELRERTRTLEDRRRLARGMAAAEAAVNWPQLFDGHSFTAEQLRRKVGRRIADALYGATGRMRSQRPRSDNLSEMWGAFPAEAIVPVTQSDCWWALDLTDPAVHDDRLPPANLRQPTLRQDGLYHYHCMQCRRHDRDATGAWIDSEAHWSCEIHQQLFSICDVRLPFIRRSPPPHRIIREQVLERDPELAAALTTIINAAIDAGSMVYAHPLEPRIIVPSRGVFKWSLNLSPQEHALVGDSVRVIDIPAIAVVASERASRLASSVTALAHNKSTPPGSAFTLAWRRECGPPKARVVTRHDLGVNALCVGPSLEYPIIEELAGHARPGYVAVVNDHSKGYNSQRLAVASRPYVGVWHPSIANVALIMTSLDFGLSCAPFFFSTFTAMVQWTIVWWLGPDGYSIYYLDDNGIVCAAPRVEPLIAFLDEMAPRCGWGYSIPKRQVGPLARCLGRRFDIDSNVLMVILSNLHRTLVLLGAVARLIDAARDDPLSTADLMENRFLDILTGTLGWLASCSYAGLLHMGPFYYAARRAKHRRVRLSRLTGLREACQWWLERAASGRLRGHRRLPCVSIPSLQIAFDPNFSGLPRAASSRSSVSDADNVATLVSARRRDGGSAYCFQLDAGAEAWALIVDDIALWGLWQPSQQAWSSGGREAYGPLQALLRFPERFRSAFLVIGFDNASDALALCMGRARGETECRLHAALFECADDLDAELGVWWCSRRMNASPDELSKCTSISAARRWTQFRGLNLVVCNDVRDDYIIGSMQRPEDI